MTISSGTNLTRLYCVSPLLSQDRALHLGEWLHLAAADAAVRAAAALDGPARLVAPTLHDIALDDRRAAEADPTDVTGSIIAAVGGQDRMEIWQAPQFTRTTARAVVSRAMASGALKLDWGPTDECAEHGVLPTTRSIDVSDRRQSETYGVCRVCKTPTRRVTAPRLAFPYEVVAQIFDHLPKDWDATALGIIRRFLARGLDLSISGDHRTNALGGQLLGTLAPGLAAAPFDTLPLDRDLGCALIPWAGAPSVAMNQISSWSGCLKSVLDVLLPMACLSASVGEDRQAVLQVRLSGSLVGSEGEKLPMDLASVLCARYGSDSLRTALLCSWDYGRGGPWQSQAVGEAAVLLEGCRQAVEVALARTGRPTTNVCLGLSQTLHEQAKAFHLRGADRLLRRAVRATLQSGGPGDGFAMLGAVSLLAPNFTHQGSRASPHVGDRNLAWT